MTEVAVFKFTTANSVRVVMVTGEPWFVLADVCALLGIGNPSMVARRLDQDALSLAEVTDSLGRMQSATTVSESGLYEVIFRSEKLEAIEFRRWVTGTVLPEIRRTGGYGTARLDPTTPDGMRLVLQAATAALAELEVVKPKAEAWDELASGEGDHSVADAAKMLAGAGIKIGQQRLFSTLHQIGWIYRRSGRWQARQVYVDRGYLRHKAQSHRHPETGEVIVDPSQVRLTIEGVYEIRDRMRDSEPLPALTG